MLTYGKTYTLCPEKGIHFGNMKINNKYSIFEIKKHFNPDVIS